MSIHPIFGISLDGFTPSAIQVLTQAYQEAAKRKHTTFTLLHVLHVLLRYPQGMIPRLLQQLNISSVYPLVSELETEFEIAFPKPSEEKPVIFPAFQNYIRFVALQAQSFGFSHMGTEHLFLGIFFDPHLTQLLQKGGITKKGLTEALHKDLDPAYLPMADSREPTEAGGGSHSSLENYSKNLTHMAEKKLLDPVIGRAKEVDRIIQILSRRTKNNPILLGEAGVGKTAIIEGLAQAIANKQVPRQLLKKKIYAIDLARLVAGTKYRGQFEERLKNLMDDVMSDRNNIVFIDEIHTLVGAGGTEGGSMDAANIMKPPLSRGEIQCIGATTLNEYRVTIEKDTALARRFQPVTIDPPSRDETIEILQGLQPLYEKFHNVSYEKGTFPLAVDLSIRFLAGRNLPDKAIDIIDEAAALVTATVQVPRNRKQVTCEEKLLKINYEKEQAMLNNDFDVAIKLQKKEKSLRKRISSLSEETPDQPMVVTAENIRQTVAKMSGVPLGSLTENEIQRLFQLETTLNQEIIGQSEAISSVCRALRRAKAELKDPNRPIASFIFMGSSGVGKTLLAQKLSDAIFNNTHSLIRFDMSEFYDKHTASRLIGAPPGYEGHKEGGQLTEQVRRKPYSVVLFDEIEKAHPDVIQVLLQILEDGQVTDSLGNKVDFRNTIIIMTSNAGASELEKTQGLGFNRSYIDNPEAQKEKVEESIKKIFRPEFINRIDEMIYFKPLTEDILQQIAKLELAKLQKRLAQRQIELTYQPEVLGLFTKDYFIKKAGARAIRRIVTQLVEDPLADALLRQDFKDGETILLTQKDGKVAFSKKKTSSRRSTKRSISHS